MKKNISFVMAFALLCILFIGTVVYATSTYSTVSISKNDNWFGCQNTTFVLIKRLIETVCPDSLKHFYDICCG